MTVPFKFYSAMAAAVMLTAIVAFTMIMVIAPDVGIEAQIACQQILYSGVCIADAAAIQRNACLLECCLCAAADTAADQNIHIQCFQ